MAWQIAATTKEVEPGQTRIVTIGKKEIGLFNVEGNYHAVLNFCPHARAPICKGKVQDVLIANGNAEYEFMPNMKALRCPWHHWEFDIDTGKAICNIHERLKIYDVKVEDDHIMIDL
jgi:nitrite reductase/ring-hydroxylating ferredoxin subunit